MDIIKLLRESDNKLAKAEAFDLATWSKLKHCKEDLELFLNYNIAQIRFKTKDGEESEIICTSNTTLIQIISAKYEKDKKKIVKLKSKGMKTPKMGSVMSWDLIDNKPKTISLKSWAI